MAKGATKSQMETPFGKKPSASPTGGPAPVNGMPLVTKIKLGSARMPTPTQTGMLTTQTPRPGTEQFAYGKSDQ